MKVSMESISVNETDSLASGGKTEPETEAASILAKEG